jgi:hypothetical protein
MAMTSSESMKPIVSSMLPIKPQKLMRLEANWGDWAEIRSAV